MAQGDIKMSDGHNDPSLQNLVGDGADNVAFAWTDSGRSVNKLAVMEPFLRGKTRDVVRRTLGLPPLPHVDGNGDERAVSVLKRIHDARCFRACHSSGGESEQETGSDDEDAHIRTAKALFGVAGMSQMAGSQGASQEWMQAFGSSQSRRPLAEERGRQDTSVREVHPTLRMSTPPASGRSYQQMTGEVAPRHKAVPQTQQRRADTDTQIRHSEDHCSKLSSSFGLVTHTSSPLSLTPPARDRSHATRRDDLPLTDLQNIPLTGTKRIFLHVQSQSPSRSLSLTQSAPLLASPSPMHSLLSESTAKRRKNEKWPSVLSEDNVSEPVWTSYGEVTSAQEAGAVAGRSTNVPRKPDLDVDAKTRWVHHRALRARSRVIEEKLRRALPMHVTPQGKMGLT
jgi:hypothetical protein